MNPVEVIPLLSAAVVALGGAVGLLYRAMASNMAKVGEKLDACERDRKELFERIIRIESTR